MSTRLEQLTSLGKAVGWTTAASILARRSIGAKQAVNAHVHGHPIKIRPVDSDLFVVSQIFGGEEYDIGDYWGPINDLAAQWRREGKTPVIIDAGANVGYSALYFVDKCPDAIVVAVEADLETYRMLCENVAGVDRIRPIHAAVWLHENGVNFTKPGALGSWAGRVDENEGRTPSMLLPSTYSDIPNAKPLLIKLDVEGAENEICASAGDVFHDVPCLMIEPHDFMLPGAGCLSPLFQALAGRKVDTLLRGENLMFIDSTLSAAPKVVTA